MQIPHSDAEKRTKKVQFYLSNGCGCFGYHLETDRELISRLKRRAAIYTEIVKSFCANKKTTDGMSLKIKS